MLLMFCSIWCYLILVSLALRKKFSDAPEILDYPLEVEIVDDRSMSVSRVHQGCILNLLNERFLIDLV